jgi:hypothetical protein
MTIATKPRVQGKRISNQLEREIRTYCSAVSMTLSAHAAAFIAAKPSMSALSASGALASPASSPLGRAIVSSVVSMGLFKKAAASVAVAVAADYSSTAIGYFDSMRVPAALIAGSSLAALFTQADKTKDREVNNRTQIESIVLIIYHILALSSLLLSLNVVVTASSTANTILFGSKNPMATSVIALLKREYEFEFLLSMWSFFVGLFSFLASVATRSLLEFELLRRRRLSSALFVLSSFGVLFFHLLAFVNSRLFLYNNLAEMTWGVLVMWFKRSTTGRRPSICSAIAIFLRSGPFSRKSNLESVDGDTAAPTTAQLNRL